jgi:tripartite-type tricarboxylate transporter receptor subunit TctC
MFMPKRSFAARAAWLMLAAAVCGQAASTGWAQAYPDKPIRIITSTIGGAADFAARFAAQGLSSLLGQPVIVDNRGSGIVIGEIAAKAPADGYTVLVAGPTLWLAPLLYGRLSWDPVRDFSPVMLAVSSPNILVVHPGVEANSVKDLITLAKARPGALNYATGGSGSTPHLAAELFKSMADVDLARINYRGAGPAFNDLIAGQVQVMFAVGTGAMPHVKSGRLRALAVTSAHPTPLVPGLPTVAASGLPGYESVNNVGLFVPAKTPAAIIHRLNQESVRAFSKVEVKERVFNSGAEVVAGSPEQFRTAVKAEMTRLGKVIRDAGIRSE